MTQHVGVLGLRATGSALARTKIQAGFNTKVWNRTSSKINALVSEGATAGMTGAEVALTSDVILWSASTNVPTLKRPSEMLCAQDA